MLTDVSGIFTNVESPSCLPGASISGLGESCSFSEPAIRPGVNGEAFRDMISLGHVGDSVGFGDCLTIGKALLKGEATDN